MKWRGQMWNWKGFPGNRVSTQISLLKQRVAPFIVLQIMISKIFPEAFACKVLSISIRSLDMCLSYIVCNWKNNVAVNLRSMSQVRIKNLVIFDFELTEGSDNASLKWDIKRPLNFWWRFIEIFGYLRAKIWSKTSPDLFSKQNKEK